jgi:hypothetical protein
MAGKNRKRRPQNSFNAGIAFLLTPALNGIHLDPLFEFRLSSRKLHHPQQKCNNFFSLAEFPFLTAILQETLLTGLCKIEPEV